MKIEDLKPVAWIEHSKIFKSDWIYFDKRCHWNDHSPLYSKQQLEAAIEATKEKAAKVCEELLDYTVRVSTRHTFATGIPVYRDEQGIERKNRKRVRRSHKEHEMTFHTRNAGQHAECEIEPMRQLWAAVIDQAVHDATTRSEEWFDAMDFLLTSRSDTQLGIIGLDADSFRRHLLSAMRSDEQGRVNSTRRKTFVGNYAQYMERKRQTDLF